jgi:hypothetical protein
MHGILTTAMNQHYDVLGKGTNILERAPTFFERHTEGAGSVFL